MTGTRKTAKPHPLLWTVEFLQDEPSYLEKRMFGCLAIYIHGRMMLALSSGEEPWNGLLLPTFHQFHQDIMKDFKGVVQHPVLKKWLYLSENQEDFESTAMDLVEAIRLGDQRIGIEPQVRKQRKSKKALPSSLLPGYAIE